MINSLILAAEHEKVDVYKIEEVVTDKGSSRILPVLKYKDLTVTIQTASYHNQVDGTQITSSDSGKEKKSSFVMYSPRMALDLQDIIKRDDNTIYEVQKIERNGVGTILQHNKYSIVLYKNQKVLKNE